MDAFLKKVEGVLGTGKVKELNREAYVAAQIKAKRKELGCSQQQLADRTGLQKSTIGRIEAGLNSPTSETIGLIAEELGEDIIIPKNKVTASS